MVGMLDLLKTLASWFSGWYGVMRTILLAATILRETFPVTAQLQDKTESNNATSQEIAGQPAKAIRKTDSIGDPLSDAARLRLGTLRFHPPAAVNDLALSPDDKTVISIGGSLIAWNAETGEQLWDEGASHSNSGYGSRRLAFSMDSSHFFAPGERGTIQVWETLSGAFETIHIQAAFWKEDSSSSRVVSVDVTPDGKTLACGTAQGLVVVNRKGKSLFEIPNSPDKELPFDANDRLRFTGPYSFGKFSPDGKSLAVVVSDSPNEILLYDVQAGMEIRKIRLQSWFVRMAFSPDGSQLGVTERDNAVRLYNVENGERVWSQVIHLDNIYENYTSAIAFSRDGKTIAAGATDYSIYLFDARSGEQTGKLAGTHWYPWTLAFTSDSKTLYSSGWDSIIRRWDVDSQKQLELPKGIHGTETVAASPDGRSLAYVDDTDTVHVVDMETSVDRRAFSVEGMHFSQLLYSPDGRLLAAGGTSGDQVQLVVWDAIGGKQRHLWKWPKGRDPHSTVGQMSFTPDCRRLAVAVFRQSAAYVWDLENGEQLKELKHGQIYSLSFSPDGQTLATAGWDSKIRFWETSDWTMKSELNLKQEAPAAGDRRMLSVCYSPYGGLLATSHMDSRVRVWRSEDLSPQAELRVPGGLPQGNISFSPDGLWLAIGTQNGAVELWDPFTGEHVYTVGQHLNSANKISFGRDTRTLVTGGSENIGYLWEMRPVGIPQDLSQVWAGLAGDDATKAYKAMWALIDNPDSAVDVLAGKLRQVKSVFHESAEEVDLSPDEVQSRKRMKKLLVDKDSTRAFEITIRRAVSVLDQVGTAEATGLLEELAEREPLSLYAKKVLKQQNAVKIDSKQ